MVFTDRSLLRGQEWNDFHGDLFFLHLGSLGLRLGVLMRAQCHNCLFLKARSGMI